MIDDVLNLTSQADDLALHIRVVAERAKNIDAQRLTDELLIVLADLKKKSSELMHTPLLQTQSLVRKESSHLGPRPKTVRLTLTLNNATIELIEYLRSFQVGHPLYGCIDICDDSIDWLAAARFSKAVGSSPTALEISERISS